MLEAPRPTATSRRGAYHVHRRRSFIGLALGGCVSATAPRAGRTAVVVDTDFSSDDILALLYLVERRDGRSDPLAGFNSFPVEWRDRADAVFGLRLPDGGGASARAVDVLHRASAGARGP